MGLVIGMDGTLVPDGASIAPYGSYAARRCAPDASAMVRFRRKCRCAPCDTEEIIPHDRSLHLPMRADRDSDRVCSETFSCSRGERS
jgi:hypothetical protein